MHQDFASKIKNSLAFKALSPERQEELVAQLFQAVNLGINTIILDNLDPNKDKETVRKLIKAGKTNDLWLYAVKRIPDLQIKLDNLIKELTPVFEQQLAYESRN